MGTLRGWWCVCGVSRCVDEGRMCILPLRGWLPTTTCQQIRKIAAWLMLTCTLAGTWPMRDVCQAIAVVQWPGLASVAVRHCCLCCATGWLLGGRKSVDLRKCCCLFGPTAVPTVGHRASTARVLQCRWQPCGLSRCWPRLLASSTDWPMLANAGQLMK
jgi:hypothetical protein